MENDNKLILWAFSQRSMGHIDFSVEELEWTNELGLRLHDVAVDLSFQGRLLRGRGTSKLPNKALAIALSEAFERIIAIGIKPGSNGLAAHTGKEEAKAAAKKELIERDAFLVNYLQGRPLFKIDWRDLDLNVEVREALICINETGIGIEVFGVAESFGLKTVVAVINGLHAKNRFGLNIGLGCEETAIKAASRALIEVIRNGIWASHKDTIIEAISELEFRNLKNVGCRDHLALALNVSYAQKVLIDMRNRAVAKDFEKIDSPGEFSFNEMEFPESFPKPPIYVAQCQNPCLQELYWGKDHFKFLNKRRMRDFLGLKSRVESLCAHPMG